MTRKYDFIRLLVFLAGVIGIVRLIDALTERRRIPEIDRFNKFTERARKVLHLAQEEAQRLKHNYIGTEHLLLGLIREGDGVAAKVLSNLGVDLDKPRISFESILGRGTRGVMRWIGLPPRDNNVR